MTTKTHTAGDRGHSDATGDETTREWTAPGGVRCVATRRDGKWLLIAGLERLVGRSWQHMRDLRIAVKQSA